MRKSYQRPQLPSHSNNVVQLSFMTILECTTAPKRGTPEDLATPHAEKQKALGAYHTGLVRRRAAVGDSVVQGFTFLGKEYSVLQQVVTMGIFKDQKSGSWNGKLT